MQGSVRRRRAGILIVGAAEPEVGSWLHAAGHATRAVQDAAAALTALGEEPADLVIVDRDAAGTEPAEACIALREDPRLGAAWLLAITGSRGRGRPTAALGVGADDYLHRPFTRAQLLARARAGLRAVQQRDDDALLRSLMATVPGAIYRSAWHAGHRLELITDEIERISGYPADNFIASARRTLISIVHPDDRDRVMRRGRHRDRPRAAVRPRVPDRARRRGGALGARPRPARPRRRRAAVDGRRDLRHHRAPEAEEALRRREIEAARTEELRASRVRIVAAADAARRKIERDLHDGAQQRLVAMALDVRMMRARAEREPADARPVPRPARGRAAGGVGRAARAGPRHPPGGADRARARARRSRAWRPRARARGGRRRCRTGRLPPTVETTAYFTVAEALTNVAKYARATPRRRCASVQEDGCLVVEVRDDGVGGARGERGLGADRPVGPRRRDRRHAQRHQPAGRGHARARRAAALLTPAGGRPLASRREMDPSEQPKAPYLDAVVAYAFRGPARYHVPGHKGGPGADPGVRKAIGPDALAADVPAGHPRDRPRPAADAVRARRGARGRGLRRRAHVLPHERGDAGQPRALPGARAARARGSSPSATRTRPWSTGSC